MIAIKDHMKQAWTVSGKRIPVTVLKADSCYIVAPATVAGRMLVGTGAKKLKNMHKPQRAQLSKAGFSFGFARMEEVQMKDGQELTAGAKVSPEALFTIGDIVDVAGTSKGKGFTGVVKRWGFKGGPRTHGQADRERAPGSIGSGTTPGRVYKNKHMAGRSGNARVTIEDLQIVNIDSTTGEIWVKGLVPGARNGVVTITKISDGKFEGLKVTPVADSVIPEPEVQSQASGIQNEEVKEVTQA